MAQKNETPVLIVSLLLTLALLGGGAWWVLNRFAPGALTPGAQNPTAANGDSDSPQNASNTPTQERLSSGERVLFAETSPEKQAGVEAIASGNFEQAVSDLEAALQANRNDPEALIYLNNAQIGDQTAYSIAVPVPAATSANPALEILRGVAQAQTEINQAGGINGVPLKVLIANDDNDPQVSRQVAEALTENSEVLGVIGHFGSEATLAAAEIYQNSGLVMISPTSTSMQLSEVGNYVFRTVPSDRFTAAALSRYMVNTLQAQNAAIYFNSESDYSQSLKDEFTTALYGDGGQILAEFDLADPAFSAADTLQQAASQDAEVLVLIANTATLDQALQVVTVNRGQLRLLGGDSIYNPKTLQVGGEAAVDMVVAVPWHILSDPQAAFVQSSRNFWGGDVNWRTAMAYDATQTLVAGLKSNPTREGIEQTLSASNFATEGATGTIRFLPSGDRNQAEQLVIIEPGSRSGYGYDFVPVQ
ncbi:amino acid ABC transporter substrate-binding protein [Leptolyngbya sp. FACHB-541]|uniref:ABC transporter substrate-binding protein n=1 Tax=Leptolyngbya sp. FACHB-541 TaxID=2692810 RepID=UPI0016851A8B|nr:ABC transporter substrate-binding protein [Leptolyngbya sp. FACHB-541]MBD1998306.1 amino acid ABC transporter substrate-binding protein [Leptolyngbya sp. FACHB-541]